MSLGKIIHTYLEEYYGRLKAGQDSTRGHARAQKRIKDEYGTELKQLASTAYALGERELGDELSGQLEDALKMTDRYFVVRGAQDATQYEVLIVEQAFRYSIGSGIEIPGRIDLITADRNGYVALWEHKTHRSIPRSGRRLRDLQTTLYRTVAHDMFSSVLPAPIDSVVWNYIRSHVPGTPELLQKGDKLSRKALDTTWHAYQTEIQRHGFDEDDYADMREKLIDRELTSYFPRSEMPLVQDVEILLRDYLVTAEEIKARYPKFVARTLQPIRNIGRQCDFCPFNRLCDAAITGGDETFIRSNEYKAKTEQQEEELDGSSRIDTADLELELLSQ